jgi:hypothetical protein
MNGYKVHHGLPLDAKLAVIAKRAGLRRGEVLALWLTLMDRASQNTPRGSVGNIDPEEIAATLEFKTDIVESALKALRDKEMVSADGVLPGWKKSQILSSTLRTRDYRARQLLKKNDDDRDDDSEEEASRRRQRLRHEVTSRHKKRGKIMTKQPSLPEQF